MSFTPHWYYYQQEWGNWTRVPSDEDVIQSTRKLHILTHDQYNSVIEGLIEAAIAIAGIAATRYFLKTAAFCCLQRVLPKHMEEFGHNVGDLVLLKRGNEQNMALKSVMITQVGGKATGKDAQRSGL